MRKVLVILFFISLFTTNINSQIIQTYGMKIGYVNSSQSYTFKPIDKITTRKSGYSIGAYIDLFNLNGLYISPEIKYIQKGVGLEYYATPSPGPEPVGDKTTFYICHNYLSIPISIGYKKQLEYGIPFIKIAPRYDILISSSDDFNSPASTFDKYKNVLGGTASIGFIPYLNVLFKPFIEFSYHMDFTNTYSSTNNKIKNNAIEINIGVQL